MASELYIELEHLLKRPRSEQDRNKVLKIMELTVPAAEKIKLIDQLDLDSREANIKSRFEKLLNGSLDPNIKLNLDSLRKDIVPRVEALKKDSTHFSILLVDDLTYITQTVSHQLKKEGYQVITAKNATEGILMFHEVIPDLVITDVRLPDFNGVMLSKIIRKLDETMPIIFISAIDINMDLNIEIEMDMVKEIVHDDLPKKRMAYLRKPILIEVLIENIEELLGRKGSAKILPPKPAPVVPKKE